MSGPSWIPFGLERRLAALVLSVDADAFLEVDLLLLDLEVVVEVGLGFEMLLLGFLGLAWEWEVEESLVFVFRNSSINSFLDRERRRSFSWAGGSAGRGWERRDSSVSVCRIDG